MIILLIHKLTAIFVRALKKSLGGVFQIIAALCPAFALWLQSKLGKNGNNMVGKNLHLHPIFPNLDNKKGS